MSKKKRGYYLVEIVYNIEFPFLFLLTIKGNFMTLELKENGNMRIRAKIFLCHFNAMPLKDVCWCVLKSIGNKTIKMPMEM